MISFETSNPKGLLQAMKGLIDSGKIKAWSYDEDDDFTLTNELWNQKAWLHPHVEEQSLNLYIFPPKDSTISKAVYAVYHARFIESTLRFLDDRLTGDIKASPFPEVGDDVGSSTQ